jgi:DNA polymerase-3 subunit gamma/tau
VQGRYKVYMIDEVHMLTGHAFNAMLKTLEEPPEHVKFILATTDPQKIPVTVLSRCLQFNLKQMPQGHIVEHLARILEAEAVPFETGALRHLAKAASGSMRDALSLLDQAIAHGAGKVEEEQVTHMLGTVGEDHLYAVFDALIAGDIPALLAVADGMEARSLSFDAALQTLATLVHRIALAQFAPEAITDETERMRIAAYAEAFDAEYLQLAYQIAIHGRDELSLAPDEYTGFTMTLLRLHAFRPDQPPALGGSAEADRGGAGRASNVPPRAAAPMARAGAPTPGAVAPAALGSTDPSVVGSVAARPAAPARAAAERVQARASTPAPASAPVSSPPSPVAASVPSPVAAAVPFSAPAVVPRAATGRDIPPWEDLPPEAFAAQDHDGGSGDVPAWPEDEPVPRVRTAPVSATGMPLRSAAAAVSRAPLAPVTAEGRATAPSTPSAVTAAPASAASPATPPADRSAAGDATNGELAELMAAADWRGVIRALGLGGMVRELAQHCEWLDHADGVLRLRLSTAHRHLLDMNRNAAERVQDELGAALGTPLRLAIEIGDIASVTPAQRDEAERRMRHANAVAALESDPFVRELIERFDATLLESSVRPL